MSAIQRSTDGHWRFHATPRGYEIEAPEGVSDGVADWIGAFLWSEIGTSDDNAAWLADHWRQLREGVDDAMGGNGVVLYLEGNEVAMYDVWDRELTRFPAEIMDQVVADFGKYRTGISE